MNDFRISQHVSVSTAIRRSSIVCILKNCENYLAEDGRVSLSGILSSYAVPDKTRIPAKDCIRPLPTGESHNTALFFFSPPHVMKSKSCTPIGICDFCGGEIALGDGLQICRSHAIKKARRRTGVHHRVAQSDYGTAFRQCIARMGGSAGVTGRSLMKRPSL